MVQVCVDCMEKGIMYYKLYGKNLVIPWKQTRLPFTVHRVRTVMKNLEKSWNFKMVISRPGKVLEKKVPKVLEKSWRFFLFIFSCRSFTLSFKS